MGVSTDALLVYGYVWEDEADLLGSPVDEEDEDYGSDEEEEEEESPEWPEIIAKRRGISDPWAGYPDLEHLAYEEQRRQGSAWTAAHRAELDAWSAAKTAIEAEYGVEIDSHGSDEWSCPVVKITNAGHRAHRGDVHAVEAADLNINPEWRTKLQRFVDDLGIDTSEAKGPGWFLVSWWG